MVNARTKGASGEREFIKILQSVVDNVFGDDSFELHRNLDQTRAGGADVEGAPPPYDFVAIEIKRQERVNTKQWWDQCERQARPGQIPVLAYRQRRQPWLIMTKGRLFGTDKRCTVTIDLETFLEWYAMVLQKAKENNDTR